MNFSSAKPENVSNEGKIEESGEQKIRSGFAQVLLDFYSLPHQSRRKCF